MANLYYIETGKKEHWENVVAVSEQAAKEAYEEATGKEADAIQYVEGDIIIGDI